MKKLFSLITIIVAIAAIIYIVRKSSRDKEVESNTIVYSGNIEIRRVNLSFRVSGRIESIAFEEGDLVSKGDLFATLDPKPLEIEVESARARRDAAKATLEKLENGARVQELDEAKAQLREYEAVLKRAESELQRNQKLAPAKAVSENALETSEETRNVAKARLDRSRAALDLLEEGTRREDLEVARANLEAEEASVVRANIALDDAMLRAPNDGIVLTRVLEPGSFANVGQTVAILSLRDSVWAYIYLEEKDLGRVAPGAPVEISTDSSSRRYKGRVGYVSPEAEFTPKTVETKEMRTSLVYRTRIIVENPDEGLRQGAPIDATIRLSCSNNETKDK